MEDYPDTLDEDSFGIALEPLGTLVEAFEPSGAVEAVGKTEQDRHSDIEHARQFRREMIGEALRTIGELANSEFAVKIVDRQTAARRLNRTERRRQNFIVTFEGKDQAEIEALLGAIDLDNPEDVAAMLSALRQVYSDLKRRLIVVEMETRRLIFRVTSEETGASESQEDRINRMRARIEHSETDAAEIILLEIDSLRQEGLDDKRIFRQLLYKYHPDVSDHEKSHQITQLIAAIYDSRIKRFLI